MGLREKLLYTLVFSLYCLIFFVIGYLLVERLFPVYLPVPDQLTVDYVTKATIAFTGVVLLSFMGASYTVFGRLRQAGVSSGVRKRRRLFRRSSNPQRTQRTGPSGSTHGGRRRPPTARARPKTTGRPDRPVPEKKHSRRRPGGSSGTGSVRRPE